MKFLVDSQLPAALARFLTSRGSNRQHVLDVGLAEATDVEIWDHANRSEAVIISKDEDFLYLANAPGEGPVGLDSFRELSHDGAVGCRCSTA